MDPLLRNQAWGPHAASSRQETGQHGVMLSAHPRVSAHSTRAGVGAVRGQGPPEPHVASPVSGMLGNRRPPTQQLILAAKRTEEAGADSP